MEFKIETKVLNDLLRTVANLTGALDFKNCVFEASKNDMFRIKSSGEGVWVSCSAKATVSKEGSFCTKADTLLSLKLKSKEVTFSVEKKKLSITGGSTKISLDILPSEEAEVTEPPKKIKVDNKIDSKIFSTLVGLMNYDSTTIEKVLVRSIRLAAKDGYLTIGTNDGSTLGFASLKHKDLKDFVATLPDDVLFELNSVISNDFEVGVFEDAIRVKTENIDLTRNFTQPEHKVEEGLEEIVKSVLEEKPEFYANLQAKAFKESVDEVSSFSTENLIAGRCTITPKGDSVSLKSKTTYGSISNAIKPIEMKGKKSFTVPLSLLVEFSSHADKNVTLSASGNKAMLVETFYAEKDSKKEKGKKKTVEIGKSVFVMPVTGTKEEE